MPSISIRCDRVRIGFGERDIVQNQGAQSPPPARDNGQRITVPREYILTHDGVGELGLELREGNRKGEEDPALRALPVQLGRHDIILPGERRVIHEGSGAVSQHELPGRGRTPLRHAIRIGQCQHQSRRGRGCRRLSRTALARPPAQSDLGPGAPQRLAIRLRSLHGAAQQVETQAQIGVGGPCGPCAPPEEVALGKQRGQLTGELPGAEIATSDHHVSEARVE